MRRIHEGLHWRWIVDEKANLLGSAPKSKGGSTKSSGTLKIGGSGKMKTNEIQAFL
jgi:hypothetical protein